MTGFSVSQQVVDEGIDLLVVTGFLDAHTYERLEDALARLIAGGRCRLIADMEAVGYVSSAGAGALIAALSDAQGGGGTLVLLRPSAKVMDTLAILGCDEMFQVAHDLKEAVAEAGRPAA